MEDHVYIIGESSGTVVKIGVSNDPERRLIQLQSSSPTRLKIRLVVPGGYPLETALHRYFRIYRVGGEWFDLRAEDPVAAVQEAIRRIGEGQSNPTKGVSLTGQVGPDCTCGHKNHRHKYQGKRACTVVGWDEWLDCACEAYEPVA